MRIGINQQKDKIIEKSNCNHRLIIPLYIPHESGYYKDAFKIFKLTIDSLLENTVFNINITICSNGCSSEINERLFELFRNGIVNELIINQDTIGKLNSINKSITSTNERFITITDADVLFVKNWDYEVFSIFENFPKAAVVSPSLIPNHGFNFTHPVWFDYLIGKRIKLVDSIDEEGLDLFAKSVGWIKKQYEIPVIQNGNYKKAAVGCGHFCATYKREILSVLDNTPTNFVLGGDSEIRFLDFPALKFGGYRLSPLRSFAFHMGNKLEEWMDVNFRNDQVRNIHEIDFSKIKYLTKLNKLSDLILNKLFSRILYNQYFRNFLNKYYFEKQ